MEASARTRSIVNLIKNLKIILRFKADPTYHLFYLFLALYRLEYLTQLEISYIGNLIDLRTSARNVSKETTYKQQVKRFDENRCV